MCFLNECQIAIALIDNELVPVCWLMSTEFSEARRRRRCLSQETSVAVVLYCALLDILKARRNGSDGLGLNFVQIELTDPQITLRNRTMAFRKLLYPYDSGQMNFRLLRSQNPPRATWRGATPSRHQDNQRFTKSARLRMCFSVPKLCQKISECSKLGARRILRANESDGLSRQALCP